MFGSEFRLSNAVAVGVFMGYVNLFHDYLEAFQRGGCGKNGSTVAVRTSLLYYLSGKGKYSFLLYHMASRLTRGDWTFTGPSTVRMPRIATAQRMVLILKTCASIINLCHDF